MDREKPLNRITANPDIPVGKPTIRGMRISVEQILDALAAGVPEEELLEDYPVLEPDNSWLVSGAKLLPGPSSGPDPPPETGARASFALSTT